MVQLRGWISRKLDRKISQETAGKKKPKKRNAALKRQLIELALSDPGKKPDAPSDEKGLKRIKFDVPKKKIYRPVEKYMRKYNFKRGEVLGPLFIRGWELYKSS